MRTKSVLYLLLAILLAACSSEIQQPPNIILIMADDLGYGDIGCYGSEFIETPVLDKLAAEGIRFSDYHSNGAVCSPTRAALMTGNYQQRSGIEGVIYAALDKRKEGLDVSEKTVGDYFSEAGYATGIFGKWHLGYKLIYNPVKNGFEEFYGYVSGNVDFISHRDGANQYDWWHNLDTCYDEGYVTDLITDRALAFMDRNKDKPFFLYIPHEAPHYPYQGRNDKADRLPGADFAAHGSRPDKKQAYKEMVEIMDENIGRVMGKLKELDIDDNTLVIFCSDNGATKLGDNGILNGFKGSLWEGGHRVPAIVRFPGQIKAGSETEVPAIGMDWLPTALSVAGIETGDPFDGIDLSQVLFDKGMPAERPLFWRYRNQWVARKGDWKYLKIREEDHLFNLSEDPGEQQNLAESNPDKLNELKQLLDEWEREMRRYEMKTE